ncbi:MAG: T9SS type A sorting domain-containing protein [Bacteroidia bacterium]|nr:T9SS type A sorting domain-containing protein [Bacteroidia bacterium]
MKYFFLLTIAIIFSIVSSQAQSPLQFAGYDCNGNSVDLFTDLDSGKAVILLFYMPNCGSCPPPGKAIQTMSSYITDVYPGMVKGYAFPFQNSTTCTYSSDWVNSNHLGALFTPMDSGATQVAYYGGFGMPTIVVLGGAGQDKRVLFSTLAFSTGDTTIMRDSILALLGNTSGISDLQGTTSGLSVYPNPASGKVSVQIETGTFARLFLDVADLKGKQIAVIPCEKLCKGTVHVQFDTSQLPNGNYLIRARVNEKIITKKLSVVH